MIEENAASSLNKETRIPPKVIPGKYSKKFTTFSCRRCGFELIETTFHYCPNCGQAILHASDSGICGWTKEDADKKFDEIVSEGRTK